MIMGDINIKFRQQYRNIPDLFKPKINLCDDTSIRDY